LQENRIKVITLNPNKTGLCRVLKSQKGEEIQYSTRKNMANNLASRIFLKRMLEQTANAQVSRVFGRYDEAANEYASCARAYWKRHMYNDMVPVVKSATTCLLDNGRYDDAFEGVRVISIMLAKAGAVKPAVALCSHVKVVEQRDPDHYKGASETLYKFVTEICSTQYTCVF